MIPNHFKLRPLGCDNITPIVMYELHQQMESNVKVHLAEAFTLLLEAQAVYIDLHQRKNGISTSEVYYAEIGKGIEALLKRYSLEWVIDTDKLEEYAHKFLTERNFKKVYGEVYENLQPDASFSFYEARVLATFLSDSFCANDFGIVVVEG